ncbi:hypothetical protein ACO0SA_004085 [Hanseniaspora valbyensis]
MNLSNSEKSFNSSSHSSNSSSFKNKIRQKILPDYNNNNNKNNKNNNPNHYNQQQVMQGSNTKLSKNGSFGSSTNNYQQQQHQQQQQELLRNKSKSFNYGEYMSTQKQTFNPLQRNVPVLQTTQNSNSNNNPTYNQQPWRQQPQQFQQHQQTAYPHIQQQQQQQQTAYSNNQQQNINYNQSISHQKSSQQLQQQKQVTNPLMRSQTNVNRNMQKHEITIDLNDFNVKANSSNLLTTYQQQQQYNKSLSMSSNYKNMIFYGPRQQQSLVYIGQNPVLKNYFRLRRLKHEELILKRNEDGTIGLNDNDNAHMTADGFVKVNVTGNRRLDNPEEYANINKERKETDFQNNERSIDDKKNKNNINKGNGNEKSSGGLKKMFKLFKNNSNEQKKNEIEHINTTTTVNTTNNVNTNRSSGQRPATLSNAPPLVINLPTSNKEMSPNFQNSPSKSPSPPKAYYMNPNFHHQQPQYKNSLHNSAVSNTSDKGLDLLLDTVLKSYDNSSDTDTDTLQYSSPVSFSPPALTARINAFAALNEGNNNNNNNGGNGIYMNRRDSVNSLASNNSSSRNSIRSLSYTNLQRLKLFQNEGEGEKDEILERLFGAFKEVKIFDEPRKKWIVYKGKKTREGRANLANRIDNADCTDNDHRKRLSFSKSVEVFQLPEDRSDSSGEFIRNNNSRNGYDKEDEEEEDEEFLKSLTEEELLKLKSMKELEMFQEIKKEINDYKSFEMLVHKDSILNTHFFM